MKIATSLIIVIALAACQEYREAGGYLRPYLAAGAAWAAVTESTAEKNMGIYYDDTGGFDFRAGLELNPYFAVELEHLSLLAADIEMRLGSDKVPIAEYSANATTLNFRAQCAFEIMQPYFYVGGGLLNANVETYTSGGKVSDKFTEFTAKVGFGGEFLFNKNAAIFLEASKYFPTGNLEDIGALPIMLGLRYLF